MFCETKYSAVYSAVYSAACNYNCFLHGVGEKIRTSKTQPARVRSRRKGGQKMATQIMKINTNTDTGFAYVHSPYNAEFVSRIKGIGGATWLSKNSAWRIPIAAVDAVREIMMDVYGETDQQASEKLSIRVRTINDLVERKGAITLFGASVAKARGRDSGAIPGEDVSFINGMPRSGGSFANWETIVPSGCEFVISGVPQTKYEAYLQRKADGFDNAYDWYANIEILSTTPYCSSVEALAAERSKLMARIEKIDKQLAEMQQ